MSVAEASSQNESDPSLPLLFRHTKREQWGLAVLMWERQGKRAYRFEDGQERVFKEGFYHLMETVAAPENQSPELQRLYRSASSPEKADVTFDDQVALFLELYPGGFEGESWSSRQRGGDRRLKRHRDPAIAEAREKMSLEVLDELISAGQHEEVLELWATILSHTDLVPAAQVKALKKATPSDSLSTSLRSYLYDTEEQEAAFDRLARALRRSGCKPTWGIMTVPRSLVRPSEHIPVRTSVLSTQLEVFGSAATPSKQPSSSSYAHCLRVSDQMRQALTEHGQPPSDMLDVHDFMWETLRPAVQDRLQQAGLRGMAASKAASAEALLTSD